MAVSLTIAESFANIVSGTPLADSLAGGGTGCDLGSVTNGSFSNVTNKTSNIGRQDIYIKHDATIDPITDVKFYIEEYGVETGYTYGGARTAADDYTAIKSMGDSSGSSKNNGDGLSSGLWIDQRAIVIDANQFDIGTYPTKVKIFGDNTTDGIDLASAFGLITDACVYNNTGTETAATSPVAGKIGKAGDTVLGEFAHVRLRQYIAAAFAEGGIYQYEFITTYSYTA